MSVRLSEIERQRGIRFKNEQKLNGQSCAFNYLLVREINILLPISLAQQDGQVVRYASHKMTNAGSIS